MFIPAPDRHNGAIRCNADDTGWATTLVSKRIHLQWIYNSVYFKGTVQPKIKNLLSFTHPYVYIKPVWYINNKNDKTKQN